MITILVLTDKTYVELAEMGVDNWELKLPQGITLYYFQPDSKYKPSNKLCGSVLDSIVVDGSPELSDHEILWLLTRVRGKKNFFNRAFLLLKNRWESAKLFP